MSWKASHRRFSTARYVKLFYFESFKITKNYFFVVDEMKKFMEKYEAQKDQSKPPDVSDYKEFKLKEDNIGYKMLQKLGWKGDGTSLGASGSGITEPINK